jgi:hypothetical protein
MRGKKETDRLESKIKRLNIIIMTSHRVNN